MADATPSPAIPVPPATQGLPAVAAANTPEGANKRKSAHPLFRQEAAEPAPAPTPVAETPAPTIPTPEPLQQAPQPIETPAPVQTPVPAPAPAPIADAPMSFESPTAPPAMQYVTPEPVAAPEAPTVDPQIKALQDQLAALTADKTAQAAAARRAELFAPAMDFENVPGIEADQAEAVYNDIMKPQLEKMYGAMEEQLNANKSYYETQISELRESSTAANQTLQQQARAKELTEQSRWVDTNQTIMSVHPSFEKDMQSAEFKAQAGQYYDELVNAYHDHNAEHVNAVMSYVKASGYQSVAESTAGLGASTATTSPVSEADAADEAYSHDKMTEMNELMRLRRIDRKSFLEFSAQYTAHHKAKNA